MEGSRGENDDVEEAGGPALELSAAVVASDPAAVVAAAAAAAGKRVHAGIPSVLPLWFKV